MMQRIGLAQSLINDPDVIFLDEPTDGVDPIGRREIRRILQWLCDQGKTIFLNSHLLSEVELICTEVAILNKGSLAAQGTIAELTRVDGNYSLVVEKKEGLSSSLVELLGDPIPNINPNLLTFNPVAHSRKELNSLIDELRRSGVEIDSIEVSKQTLEDSFISLLDKPMDDHE
jgi:ABC-2 type transport system ATP-binding protein